MIFISLLISLLLTFAIEVPIAYMQKIPLKVAFSVNLITNPTVVILYHWAKYYQLPIIWVVIVLEIAAIIFEGYFYKDYYKKPWRFALCVNALSFGIGLLLQRL